MSILIFVIMLFVLVLVHEFGHFIVAKWAKMRVDEFGFGFPPRAAKLFHKNGTDYTLNWIPFGGFVKIYGENGEESGATKAELSESFSHKSKWAQAAVLVAGVSMNVIAAWVLLSIGLMSGTPTSIGDKLGGRVTGSVLTITQVISESPAQKAGIKVGDVITKLQAGTDTVTTLSPDTLKSFIETHGQGPVTISVNHSGIAQDIVVTPATGVVGKAPAIGVSMDMIGKLKLGFFESFMYGAQLTGIYLKHTAQSLGGLFVGLFKGTADLASVTGPVGLVGVIGDAYQFGMAYVLSLAALISINLAIINLLPIPALDGGRLLFVGIEAIIRRPIKQKISNIVNTVGFFALIALMLVVTVRDVIHLF